MKTVKFIQIMCLFLLATFSRAQQPSDNSDHILAPNDSISVQVFLESDLDTKVVVSRDGKVTLQLIGEVKISGLTTADAAKVIALRYKDGWLVNPSVTVKMADYAKKRFTILGAVTKPASYYFPDGEGLNLLQAIGMAGGYSRVANPSRITVKRASDGRLIKVDGKELAKEGARPFPILPNDIITVKESFL